MKKEIIAHRIKTKHAKLRMTQRAYALAQVFKAVISKIERHCDAIG